MQHREHGSQRMSARPDGKALCAALRSGPDAGHRRVVWVRVLQRNKSQKDVQSGVPHSRVFHFTARQRYCSFLQTEGLCQPCMKQVYGHHFPTASPHSMTLSHFGNFHQYFKHYSECFGEGIYWMRLTFKPWDLSKADCPQSFEGLSGTKD